MTPSRENHGGRSMSVASDADDMDADTCSVISSPPRSCRKNLSIRRNIGRHTPKSGRLLFEDSEDEDDDDDTENLLRRFSPPRIPNLRPLDLNHDLTTEINEPGQLLHGRKRSSAERRGETTTMFFAAAMTGTSNVGPIGTPKTHASPDANSTMLMSPRISPNSFITMDGRYVQSKNPFSSPIVMMEETTPHFSSSSSYNGRRRLLPTVDSTAPSLPTSFSSAYDRDKSEEGDDTLHHLPGILPRGAASAGFSGVTPRAQRPFYGGAHFLGSGSSLLNNGGYPDKRYGFTGSPILETSPATFEHMETDAASSGSLHKVRRLKLTDDVVAASGQHFTNHHRFNTSARKVPSLAVETDLGPAWMGVLSGKSDDHISPTDVTNFPPPTPVKERPSRLQPPYTTVRRPEPQTPILERRVRTARTPHPPGSVLRRRQFFNRPEDDESEEDLDDSTSTFDDMRNGSSEDINQNGARSCSKKHSQSKSRFHGDFDIIGELGKGSFGTVYKVLSRLDGCMYAIKAAQRKAKGPSDRDRMLKEVYALAALSDQADTATFHIVRYHQAWMEDDRLYIQTELCTGTLSTEIAASHPVPEHRLYKLLREICLALQFIHRNNMVHLDIKPDNIFLKNDQFKLGDFGLVTKSSGENEVEEGDSRYMSMELLSGEHGDLTKSDIFSLGATMYEICLGRQLPMNGPEWQDIRAGRLQPLLNSPVDLVNIIHQMMQPNAADRPAAIDLLKHEQLLSEEQKALIAEKSKVIQANFQLAAQAQRFKKLTPGRRGLTRANTWSGDSLSNPYI